MSNIDMGALMDLFKEKLAWSMAQADRKLSLEEDKARRETDLKYAQLEAQLKTDKDKLDFEKMKVMTGYEHGLNMETLKNSGLLDVERLKSASEKEKAEITAAASRYGHDRTAEAHILGAKLTASHRVGTDKEGNKASVFDPESYKAIDTAIRGPVKSADTQIDPERLAAAASTLQELRKSGAGKHAADTFVNLFDPALRPQIVALAQAPDVAEKQATAPAHALVTPAVTSAPVSVQPQAPVASVKPGTVYDPKNPSTWVGNEDGKALALQGETSPAWYADPINYVGAASLIKGGGKALLNGITRGAMKANQSFTGSAPQAFSQVLPEAAPSAPIRTAVERVFNPAASEIRTASLKAGRTAEKAAMGKMPSVNTMPGLVRSPGAPRAAFEAEDALARIAKEKAAQEALTRNTLYQRSGVGYFQ
jgi:hypothetical protein